MFNAPRPGGGAAAAGAGAGVGGVAGGAGLSYGNLGASFVDDNPLAGSVYDDGLDPWSAAPSPTPTPAPQVQNRSVFSSVIADATVPSIYIKAFIAVDPNNTGETSVNSLSRVLATSSLPAATIDRIVNLVSSRPRVSKLEFFVALALVALAQSGKDVSIEQVAALSQHNTLPEPSLDLDRLAPSSSTFAVSPVSERITSPRHAPAYSDDPWNFTITGPAATSGPAASLGTGLPPHWWKKQESARVTILGQQGFILNRYMVYEVTTDRGPPVPRRYSEFTYLWECLLKRYPFRLIPALPPKRLGPDEQFLEQRRRGLARALAFILNHPVLREDGVLSAFLTEPSFETWRKHTPLSLDEESLSKRIDRIEEMSIPGDLDEKLATIRNRLNPLIDQWQRISILAERIIKRREAAAVRLLPAHRRSYLPTYFALSSSRIPLLSSLSLPLPYSSSSSSSSPALSSSAPDMRSPSPAGSTMTTTTTTTTTTTAGRSYYHTGAGLLASSVAFGHTNHMNHNHNHNHNNIYNQNNHNNNNNNNDNDNDDVNLALDQGDMSRLTNTLRAVAEVNERCWRGDECELSGGVRGGLDQLASHAQRFAEISEMRTRTLFDVTLENLKSQRDLYLATRDLFLRHDRLSFDQVERLKKRAETNLHRLEGVRAAAREGWHEEADRLAVLIEKDQAAIASQLNRRVFIRACVWHEVRVLLHNRENAMLSLLIQTFAREEQAFTEQVLQTWASLGDAVEVMPFE